jgi:hypothetical protein
LVNAHFWKILVTRVNGKMRCKVLRALPGWRAMLAATLARNPSPVYHGRWLTAETAATFVVAAL